MRLMASDPSTPPVLPTPSDVPLAKGQEHTQEEWEKAAAAVLRKSRRLADDTPDSEAWAVLATTTLDGIAVSPLGTPALVADLPDTGLLARTAEVSGGDIRNVVLAAVYDAVATDEPVGMRHVGAALARELVKLGRRVPPADWLNGAVRADSQQLVQVQQGGGLST